ncbi:hypothetical protein HNQ56_003414 [Anaerotaenia torta]|uniref:beta-L-arabinofuranosidase domain-containing protein n=1 Tax=Anaerotaenia torta TaxID=433293 RepID=UPI003D2350EA
MLKELKLNPFTVKEIKPQGWLKKQLEIQADALSGNLHKFWPDIKESKWIGGDREGWERVPYWLDGYIPLAFLLEDEEMKKVAKQYIHAILDSQKEDGWICPCEDGERPHYDMWALFLILKVLTLYHDCIDNREEQDKIQTAVFRALKNLEEHIDTFTLFGWAAARWYECLISIYWLYDKAGEEWLLMLAYKIRVQGFDYQALYENWDYEAPKRRGAWSQMNHVVNQAMAVKAGGLFYRVSRKEDDLVFPKEMLEKLSWYHGTVTGVFTGDECLAGRSPIQGTELCAVVELMYSLEQLIGVSGDVEYADRLEKAAFNALPATFSEDMWTHQYDQQVNQPCCQRIPEEEVHFTTNSGESHLFGLEPNYGCCTANMHQGYPKFALSCFYRTAEGIAAAVLAPCAAETVIKGKAVKISLDTEYPFSDALTFTVEAEEPVEFQLDIRIPGFVQSARVNGEDAETGRFYSMKRIWEGKSTIIVELNTDIRLVERGNGLAALVKEPLVYSLAIEENWKMIDYGKDESLRVFPHCDYEVYPASSWNYGFAGEKFEFRYHGIKTSAFSAKYPPCTIEAAMAEVPWSMKHGIPGGMPDSTEAVKEAERKIFYPFGCTTLRMTEMPRINS